MTKTKKPRKLRGKLHKSCGDAGYYTECGMDVTWYWISNRVYKRKEPLQLRRVWRGVTCKNCLRVKSAGGKRT